jgi:hypothetical protein
MLGGLDIRDQSRSRRLDWSRSDFEPVKIFFTVETKFVSILVHIFKIETVELILSCVKNVIETF